MKRYTSIAIAVAMLTACESRPAYDASGIFEAETVTLSAETSGTLLTVNVNEGDSVTMGAPVAVVDTAMLVLQRGQLASQQQAVESSAPDISSQVAAMRAEIAHQEQECQRLERLLAAGGATTKQVEDARSQLGVMRDRLASSLSTLGKNRRSVSGNALALQYQLEQVERQIAKSTITAPLTGTVLERYFQPGEFVTPGRPVVKMADLSNIYLRAYFTADHLASLSLGQEVKVVADFGAGERYEYPGRVQWISQDSEFTPKSIQTPDSRANLVYAVKIAVKNDGRLKLGQYGEVTL